MMFLLDLTWCTSSSCAISPSCVSSAETLALCTNVPVGTPAFCGTEAGGVRAHILEVAVTCCLTSSNALPKTHSCTSAFQLHNRGAAEKCYSSISPSLAPHMMHLSVPFLCESLLTLLHVSSKQFKPSLAPAFPGCQQVSWALPCKLLSCQSLRATTSLMTCNFVISMPRTVLRHSGSQAGKI